MNLPNTGENKKSIIIIDLYFRSSWIPPNLGKDQTSTEEKVGPLSNTLQVLYVLKHVVINEKKKYKFIFLEEKGQHIIKH